MKIIPLTPLRIGSKSVIEYITAIKNGQDVTPSKDKQQVKNSSTVRTAKVFYNQKEAMEHAREITINQQIELSIHGKNGRIIKRDSYGNDSFPPRG